MKRLLLLPVGALMMMLLPVPKPVHAATPVAEPLFIQQPPLPPPPQMMTQAQLLPLLKEAGTKYHVDKDLLASLLTVESGGQVNAVSRTGAQGLMQLMPETATQMGVKDSFVAEQNIAGGAAYMGQLLKHFHDRVTLAVAAYNAGPHAVERYHGVPPFAETRNYVHRVIGELHQRKKAEQVLAVALRRHKATMERG